PCELSSTPAPTDSTRSRVPDESERTAPRLQADFRKLRRLARARCTADDRHGMLRNGRCDLILVCGDRERRIEGEPKRQSPHPFDMRDRAFDPFSQGGEARVEVAALRLPREQSVELAREARAIREPRVLKALAQLEQRHAGAPLCLGVHLQDRIKREAASLRLVRRRKETHLWSPNRRSSPRARARPTNRYLDRSRARRAAFPAQEHGSAAPAVRPARRPRR